MIMKILYIARSHLLKLFLISIFLTSCTGLSGVPKLLPERNLYTPGANGNVQASSSVLEIYFTKPESPHASEYKGGPDTKLAAAIDEARLSVDIAAYSLTLWSIRNALIHAHQRGVVVRMVMETDNLDSEEVQDIMAAGIPVVGDQREGLMHNKFVVIDQSQVWTGSMNFTVGGAYRDNNDLICIHSSKAAEDYTNEFEEMFVHHLFGPNVIADTPYPKLIIGGFQIEIYFSPDDGVASRLVELIKNANSSINFLAYSFTSDKLAAAIRERYQNGVKVSGVMDTAQVMSNQGGEFERFKQDGIDVVLDGNQTGLMHHKVMIIDRKIVITGSYNFSASAEENNDENVVIIFSPEIANQYLAEFSKIYSSSSQ